MLDILCCLLRLGKQIFRLAWIRLAAVGLAAAEECADVWLARMEGLEGAGGAVKAGDSGGHLPATHLYLTENAVGLRRAKSVAGGIVGRLGAHATSQRLVKAASMQVDFGKAKGAVSFAKIVFER